VTIIPHCVI